MFYKCYDQVAWKCNDARSHQPLLWVMIFEMEASRDAKKSSLKESQQYLIVYLGILPTLYCPVWWKNANGGKDESEKFFSFRFFSARMVIECVFGRLKYGYQYERITKSYKFMFALNNFCEERKNSLNKKHINIALNYDKEFQPPTESSYKVSNNETGGKVIR